MVAKCVIGRSYFSLVLFCVSRSTALSWFSNQFYKIGGKSFSDSRVMKTLILHDIVRPWDSLLTEAKGSSQGLKIDEEDMSRANGGGLPHTDAKLRLFGSLNAPRLTFFRDSAAWCPYCQKVWIFLEEKRIPYKIEKINMRSYGDKPQAFLRMVPNGLLPAIILDGAVSTESLDIMLMLDKEFSGPLHPSLWPDSSSPEQPRAKALMRLERELFSLWCSLVFRPSVGSTSRQRFERGLDEVENELLVTPGPWFLNELSIVDLTFVSHIERMVASVAYWSGFKVRDNKRWPALDRWLSAFEERPSYMATKSDYYTHVMDIPPQYGPGYSVPGSESFARSITGAGGSWALPLPPFRPDDLEPVSAAVDPGEEAARQEAAYKLARNHENIVKFALRGAGSKGAKQFQAPLADPYATPALEHSDDMDVCLRYTVQGLLEGYTNVPPLALSGKRDESASQRRALQSCIAYLRDRVGVPRDMSYPAARQLRAHLNWVIGQLQ